MFWRINLKEIDVGTVCCNTTVRYHEYLRFAKAIFRMTFKVFKRSIIGKRVTISPIFCKTCPSPAQRDRQKWVDCPAIIKFFILPDSHLMISFG